MCQCLPGQCSFADMDVVLAQALRPLSPPGGVGEEFPPQILSTSFRSEVPKVRRRVDLLADRLRKSLALIAPTCEALLKSRKHCWIQLSGHAGAFYPAGPETVWKKRLTRDAAETRAYERLMLEPVRDMVPHYYGECQYNNHHFIEMEDLLQHFTEPCVMDVKMGTRTFLESEVSNPALRPDLYEKLSRLAPDEPTGEERRLEAVTKLRYMTYRERESSTATLGFRVEGVKLSNCIQPVSSNNLKKTKTREQVCGVISQFLPPAPPTDRIRKALVDKLRLLRKRFQESHFFNTHEIIGSSLLLIYDSTGACGVWMIDFAKTVPVPQATPQTTPPQPVAMTTGGTADTSAPPGPALNHRTPWVLGNHEDGYLTGLDNLIQIMEEGEWK